MSFQVCLVSRSKMKFNILSFTFCHIHRSVYVTDISHAGQGLSLSILPSISYYKDTDESLWTKHKFHHLHRVQLTHADKCSLTHTDRSVVELIRDQRDTIEARCTSCFKWFRDDLSLCFNEAQNNASFQCNFRAALTVDVPETEETGHECIQENQMMSALFQLRLLPAAPWERRHTSLGELALDGSHLSLFGHVYSSVFSLFVFLPLFRPGWHQAPSQVDDSKVQLTH